MGNKRSSPAAAVEEGEGGRVPTRTKVPAAAGPLFGVLKKWRSANLSGEEKGEAAAGRRRRSKRPRSCRAAVALPRDKQQQQQEFLSTQRAGDEDGGTEPVEKLSSDDGDEQSLLIRQLALTTSDSMTFRCFLDRDVSSAAEAQKLVAKRHSAAAGASSCPSSSFRAPRVVHFDTAPAATRELTPLAQQANEDEEFFFDTSVQTPPPTGGFSTPSAATADALPTFSDVVQPSDDEDEDEDEDSLVEACRAHDDVAEEEDELGHEQAIEESSRKSKFRQPAAPSVDIETVDSAEEEEEEERRIEAAAYSGGQQLSLSVEMLLPGDSAGQQLAQQGETPLTPTDPRRESLSARRLSNALLASKMSRRSSSTTLLPLSSAQIVLVRQLWRSIYRTKGPTVLASTLFHKLFLKELAMRDAFRQVPLPAGHANRDTFMKWHCKATGEMLDEVISSLDNLDAVVGRLEAVGGAHVGLQVNARFWNAMAESFIDCTLEWGDKRARTDNVRKGWALLVAFIVEKIKSGHLEQRRSINSTH